MDDRRVSPRKSAGLLPHYSARESIEQKGGGGEELKRRCEEAGSEKK